MENSVLQNDRLLKTPFINEHVATRLCGKRPAAVFFSRWQKYGEGRMIF